LFHNRVVAVTLTGMVFALLMHFSIGLFLGFRPRLPTTSSIIRAQIPDNNCHGVRRGAMH